MGKKKSKRNKKNNGGQLRKGLDAVPTAAAPPATANIFMTVGRLLEAGNFEKIFKIESKYRHLATFCDHPFDDAYVLTAFGHANGVCSQGEACMERAIHYYERAIERVEDASDVGQYQARIAIMKITIEMNLSQLYSDGRDMEKAISSHRWLLENCNRHGVTARYVINISHKFNRFEKYEYTIEVLEGAMAMDMIETFEDKVEVKTFLIDAYIGFGEFLKAKAANKNRINHWETAMQSGMIEVGLCNYKAAIACFRELVAAERQKQEYDDSLSETRDSSRSVGLARTLLLHSAANKGEAFAIFQEELNRCVDPLDREEILIQMGTEYRKLNKWDQSIEALHQLCLSSTRPDGTMLPQANEAMAQTYLEQYCTDTTLDIDQRAEILCHATSRFILSFQVHIVSTEMHLTQAQLFHVSGDKQQAYHHLELYLDARLAECKLSCYTCEQRVRHGSVSFIARAAGSHYIVTGSTKR